MADPLSVVGPVLAVATAAIQSTRSLKEAVGRYKTRDINLRRLLNEIEDAEKTLSALRDLLEAANSHPTPDVNISIAALLREPIERYSEICSNFEHAMEPFSKISKTGFLDWAKMEFMRGDLNQFLDTVAGYKATISAGLGVLTMLVSSIALVFSSIKYVRTSLESANYLYVGAPSNYLIKQWRNMMSE